MKLLSLFRMPRPLYRLTERHKTPGRWFRWTHEGIFSLNVAWGVVWVERVNAKHLGGPIVASSFARLFQMPILYLASIGGRPVVEQIVWSLALALIVFVSLRGLSRFAVTEVVLKTIAGVSAIVIFPMAMWLPAGPAYQIAPYHIAPTEVVVVLFCGAVYYLRKLPISDPLMLAILLVHFITWAWITGRYEDIPYCINTFWNSAPYYHSCGWAFGLCSVSAIFMFGFPVIGLLAGVTWMRYVRDLPVSVIK